MAESQRDRRRWFALAVIVTAQFMVVLDVAIVNVALPTIKTDLGFSQENLQWVVTAYSIMFGGVLLLGGRMADLLGRRRLFMAGLTLFTASSLLDGLAWSEGSLIGFRALQGLGAALASPAALSILTTTFTEGKERNFALGIWGAVSGTASGFGVSRRRRLRAAPASAGPLLLRSRSAGRPGGAAWTSDHWSAADQRDRRAGIPPNATQRLPRLPIVAVARCRGLRLAQRLNVSCFVAPPPGSIYTYRRRRTGSRTCSP
jgi:MFS family permease